MTVEMANQLMQRGHDVRITYRCPPSFSLKKIRSSISTASLYLDGLKHHDWFHNFSGKVEPFKVLEKVNFAKGEIVIAAGTYTVLEVYKLHKDVVKLRYCHGFSDNMPELTRQAWSIAMPTIAVSSALVPRLERMSSHPVIGMVPNGINLAEYYKDPNVPKDGLGTVYNHHWTKDPETTLELLARLNLRCSTTPQYVFGADPCPKGVAPQNYWRYPSVAKARELYNRSKVWFVPSRNEGFCLPILEAMACGCAVVSTENDAAPTLIDHGRNGLLVPVGDVEGFLNYIELLVKDETLRRKMVAEGLQTVRQYTWENAVTRMEACLRRVTEETCCEPPKAVMHF